MLRPSLLGCHVFLPMSVSFSLKQKTFIRSFLSSLLVLMQFIYPRCYFFPESGLQDAAVK